MESNYVSVFKLDGVPILPPLVNEEVRAAVAIYRQKAIEVEKRLQERKRTLAVNNTVDSELIDSNLSIVKGESAPLDKEDEVECGTLDHKTELEAIANLPTVLKLSEGEESLNQSEESTITVPSEALCDPSPQKIDSHDVIETVEKVQLIQSDIDCNLISGQIGTDVVKQPNWQSPTRTVTPTSEESMGWFPLVRSNTYNLEKPSIDLMNLQRVDHSTPIDRSKVDPSLAESKDCSKPKIESKPATPKLKAVVQKDNTPVKAQSIVFSKSKTDRVKKSPKEQQNPGVDPSKCRQKRRTVSRKISHSSVGSGVESDRAFESVAHALTIHEQRMMELLKRQEEERLLLEQSFREKTQELVALCAKSLTIETDLAGNESSLMMPDCNRTKTPDMQAASSVSQLSLCDVSYDSCTDTDDAAYQTCHANGTSEENDNNNERTLTEDDHHPLADGNDPIVMINTAVHTMSQMQDNNGNDVISLLPQRMKELQRNKAATTINAYARGYLTRRLFKTDEVESIKRTIADIICFIISLQTQAKGMKEDTNQAAVRRDAGKHIAFCLDRLHDIFVNYTPQERLQLIRQDRCLKRKSTLLPKVHKQFV